LLEPDHHTLDVNLKAVVNTAYLALHHFRKQGSGQGSLVCNASAASYQRFRIVDYATAKHGVLGLIRGLHSAVRAADVNVRINGVAPNWTVTGMVPEGVVESTGHRTQPPSVVANSVAFLMADQTQRGHVILSEQGKYWEVEDTFQKLIDDLGDLNEVEDIMDGIEELARQSGGGAGSLPGSKS
jgi:NAD(P)-dependent dehydrogenase (short-subunit alcohol dehydrogenase family)